MAAGSGGRIRTNRPGYSTTYNGLELTLNKRLANRWMGRIAFSWNDWVENFDGTGPRDHGLGGNPGRTEKDALVDGGQVAPLSGGSGKASFYTSIKWQLYANGLVQLPGASTCRAALFARQGGPYPISVRIARRPGRHAQPALHPGGRHQPVRATSGTSTCAWPRTSSSADGSGLTLSAELFNVLNSDLVLSRCRYANASAFADTVGGAESGLGRIEEVISPSIFRVGARFSF